MYNFKCNTCGADLQAGENANVIECIFCGTHQIVPNIRDEKKNLMDRASIFLEYSEWDRANEYFEKVLDLDPDDAKAYVGKLMVDMKVKTVEALSRLDKPFGKNINYQKAVRFAGDELKEVLISYESEIIERNKQKYNEDTYELASEIMKTASSGESYLYAAEKFKNLYEYKDSKEKYKFCRKQAEKLSKLDVYNSSVKYSESNLISSLNQAVEGFAKIKGYKNSDELNISCKEKIAKIKRRRLLTAKIIIPIILVIAIGVAAQNIWMNSKLRKYNIALQLIEDESYSAAIGMLRELGDYKDSIQLIDNATDELRYFLASNSLNNGQYEDAINAFSSLGDFKDSKYKLKEAIEIKNNADYNDAVAFIAENKYKEAISLFLKLGEYKDSKEKLNETNKKLTESQYKDASDLFKSKNYAKAIHLFVKLGTYKDSADKADRCRAELRKPNVQNFISTSTTTLALKSNGTVLSTAKNDVSGWKNIVAVANGYGFDAGLKADGTVVVAGENEYGDELNVSDWKNIAVIYTGGNHLVGLKRDGTVVAVGSIPKTLNIKSWTDIVAISSSGDHALGLKADGTVVATGNNADGQCEVDVWTDIIAIAAGSGHSLGLKSDGTVVAVGYDGYGRCSDTRHWSNIIAVCANNDYSFGLKADGTVVKEGYDKDYNPYTSKFKNLVAISSNHKHIVGVKSDGRIVVGLDFRLDDDEEERDKNFPANSWKDIKTKP